MPKVYIVGGAIRDYLLGKPVKDLDFAVEADSFQSMEDFLESLGVTIFLRKPEYFTLRGRLPCGLLGDFVLCRKESEYRDGRHPDRVEIGTITEDLARRDYTVNAMALPLDPVYLQSTEQRMTFAIRNRSDIVDPYGGIYHLEPPVLQAVGNVYDRWKEDSLRCLRALRFKITKGFTFAPEIEHAFHWEALPGLLQRLSADRCVSELSRCFEFDTVETLQVLTQYLPPAVLQELFTQKALWLTPTLKRRTLN